MKTAFFIIRGIMLAMVIAFLLLHWPIMAIVTGVVLVSDIVWYFIKLKNRW